MSQRWVFGPDVVGGVAGAGDVTVDRYTGPGEDVGEELFAVGGPGCRPIVV